MEPIPIKLPKDTYLSDIEPFKSSGLDTDSQYDKTITGIGISTFAIRFFLSHLVMTLPNMPVVKAKVDEHNEKFPGQLVLGVYKGITIAKIKAYLLSNVKHKKIITTPEGFNDKVIKAFSDISELYKNFYMLIDESERIISDVSYRGAIAAPLNHFFKFNRKGMVSATTLPFSDPRFKEFKNYVIEPQYDYSKPITLVSTNNVIESLKLKLEELNSNHVAIFFNSTKGINAVIKGLGLKSKYMVFCAENSVLKLLDKDIPFERVTDDFTVHKMKSYNFFTSRYFSAIDIKLDYKPDIILVSDILFADHSILDPKTEVIQIPGRFRNGINSLTHITNYNPDLVTKTPTEAMFYLEGLFEAYNDFVKAHDNASNIGRKDAYYKAMTESKAHSFYIDRELNTAMVDNFIHEERVKEYYKAPQLLKQAYSERSKHFVVTHQEDIFDAGDKDLFGLHKSLTQKEKFRLAAAMLYNYKIKSHAHLILFKPTHILSKLRAKYPIIAEGVDYLDEITLENTNYVISAIRKAIDDVKEKRELKRMAPFIYSIIKGNHTHIQSELRILIKKAYSNANTKRKLVTNDILLFFAGDRSTELKKNVYKLRERLFSNSENVNF
ncbi:MAG: hypothetical protein JWR05_3383 [Mucilaginibacter sp.]|nr:hypothetical protein [Mucilaginibacter sp.]